MSKMADIAGEMENLKADVISYKNRMLIERDIADYWYYRCMKAEGKLNDALDHRPEGKTS